jgi:hypothetical protein
MNEIENWIKSVQQSHPDLKGHSVCPFAKANTYKIINCSINDIQPLNEEFGVVIFIVEDDLDIDYGYQKIKELNQKYPKYKFFDDFRDEPSFINGIQTNNGLHNLILYQDAVFLTKMRQILAKTNYYDLWDDEYLQKILEQDYEMVQKIRNK